jgi:hypothetical protein
MPQKGQPAMNDKAKQKSDKARERREAKIRQDAASAAFERGKRAGREELQEKLRELLGLDEGWL